MKKHVLVIGPFPDPINGESIANQQVVKILNQNPDFSVKRINTIYPVFQDKLGRVTFKKIIFFIKPYLQLFKIFGRDIIYITPGRTYYGVLKYSPFILLASLLKKEIVIHIHGNNLKKTFEESKVSQKKRFHYLLSKTTKGIVLSDSLRNNLTPFIEEEKVFTLSNFADDFLILKEEKIETSTLKILFLSNLMIGKGIVELLESLKKLESLNINYEAVIAGNYDLSNKQLFFNYFNELKNTEYTGVVTGNRKKELLHWANIFVLPTYLTEGQPISIIEAMATSNVIVTTRLVGILDLVDEKSGYFVEPKNIESIVSVLKYIDNHKYKMKNIAAYNKKLFIENYTVRHFEKKLIKILNS